MASPPPAVQNCLTYRQIRQNDFTALPSRFYGYQLFVLLVPAVVFTWLSRDEALDRWITEPLA